MSAAKEDSQVMETSPMDCLPPELLCYILSKLDGHSMACAAKVCQRWHHMILVLGKGFNIWYRRCVEELGLDAIVTQTGLVQLLTSPGRAEAESRKEDWEFWRKLYAANQHYKCLGSHKWKLQAEEMIQFKKVTATSATVIPPTATRDGTLWFGTKDGQIYNGTLKQDWQWQWNREGDFWNFCTACTDMTLITLGGCLGYSTGSQEPQTFVVTTSIYGDVRIISRDGQVKTSIQPRYHQAYCVSALGPYFVVGHDGAITRGLVIYKLVLEETKRRTRPHGMTLAVVPIIKLSGFMYSNVKAVALTHNQVVAGDDHGVVYTWTIPSLSNFEGVTGQMPKKSSNTQDSVITVDKPASTVQLGTGVEQVLIHHGQVIILTSVGDGAIIVIDNKDWETLYEIHGEKIRALTGNVGYIKRLAPWGSMLAVGSYSGEVLLLRAASLDWVFNLTSHVISHFSSKLTKLVTLNFCDDGQGTVLVASGNSTCTFRWRRQSKKRFRCEQK